MKQPVLLSLALASTILLTGCATLFGDNSRTVVVNTQPSGAQINLNGQPIGRSPATVELASINDNYIQIIKSGYQTTSVPIAITFQNVGLWNILFWPGFIVDAVSGDMMKINNPNINVTLVPLDNVQAPDTPVNTQANVVKNASVTPTPASSATAAPSSSVTPATSSSSTAPTANSVEQDS